MPRKAAKKVRRPEEAAPSKRQQVLEYLADNPEAKSGEVAAALKEKGVEITSTYVSNIKSTSKVKGKRGGKRGRKAGVVATARKLKAAPDLATAAQLVAQLGGLEQAKKTIEQLEEIKKLV